MKQLCNPFQPSADQVLLIGLLFCERLHQQMFFNGKHKRFEHLLSIKVATNHIYKHISLTDSIYLSIK